jgi:CheY-like chemotaxis protein
MIKTEDPQEILFTVSDTGKGISKDYQSKIFDPFTQEDASTSREYGGTGLGLSICKKLVTLMGGKIPSKSELGKGSEFQFNIFPIRQEDVLIPIEQSSGELTLTFTKKPTILIVEDNKVNQNIMKKYLIKLELDFQLVSNGLEATLLAETQEFDIIFMDLQMPVLGGIEATRIIREIEVELNRSPSKIIALTANVFKEDEENCLKQGMDDFLKKPIKMKVLKTSLNKHCS